jgi:hypothetical protein
MDEHHGWIDAAEKQPTHGRKVLALSARDNIGYEQVGYRGRPCAIITARWDQQQKQWRGLIGSGWSNASVIWWRELPPLPENVFIIPPNRE